MDSNHLNYFSTTTEDETDREESELADTLKETLIHTTDVIDHYMEPKDKPSANCTSIIEEKNAAVFIGAASINVTIYAFNVSLPIQT